ncbi:MAG: hypothetical protein R3E83_11045 [Burkholderiaceae bacterium]
MSLQLNPDFEGTLSVVRAGDGRLQVSGKHCARFGYVVDGDQGAWVRWDWQDNTLIVENDRFGFTPLYYAAVPNGIHVATSIHELLALGIDRSLDDEALSAFLRLGQYLGDDTPFKAIRALAPGTRLRWHDGRLSLEQRVSVLPTAGQTISRDEAVRRYGELMQAAVERMIPAPGTRMSVPLSAGRDSRHILYALVRAGCKPDQIVTARAMAPRPDTDAQVASQIAAALGLPHTIIEQSADRYRDERQKNLLTGYFADEHVQMMPVARWLREHRIEVTWDGIAGDIFSCGVYDKPGFIESFQQPGMRTILDSELGDDGYLNTVLRPDAMARWPREMAEQRLLRELERYRDLPNPIAPYFFLNRVRRKLALSPFGMLDRGTHVLAPYLDHDLFDTLIGLPFSYFTGRLFHSEAIDAFYPELPRFPYTSVHEGFIPERRDRIWNFVYQLARDALDGGASQGRPSVTRRSLLARLSKAVVSRDYGTRVPQLFGRLVVLMHLESELTSEVRS